MDSYACLCDEGWLGTNCDNADDCQSEPCSVGTCEDAGEDSYTCICDAGEDGPLCNQTVTVGESVQRAINDVTVSGTSQNTNYNATGLVTSGGLWGYREVYMQFSLVSTVSVQGFAGLSPLNSS